MPERPAVVDFEGDRFSLQATERGARVGADHQRVVVEQVVDRQDRHPALANEADVPGVRAVGQEAHALFGAQLLQARVGGALTGHAATAVETLAATRVRNDRTLASATGWSRSRSMARPTPASGGS